MKIKTIFSLLILASATLFISCGGDEEDDDAITVEDDDTVDDVEDTTPPTLVSVTPNQEENVPVNTVITFTFSEPMDVNSFIPPSGQGENNVYLNGGLLGSDVPFTISASENDIILTPSESLDGGDIPYSYGVFTDNISDLAGNLLATNEPIITGTFITLNTPLEVTSISPGDGQENVGLNPSIVITFSKNLNPNFVDEAAFFFQQASGPEISTSFSISGNQVTLTPGSELTEFRTRYRTAITGGLDGTQVRAADGNYLAQDVDFNFTTEVVSEDYYYIIDGNGGPYLALEERSTTRPNGYRNLDLIVSLNTSKSLWRPVKSSYQGRTAYGFVNKLDDDNDFYGKDNPQFLYGISPDDGQAEIYSNRPPNTSTGFYANQLWELISEGTANGDSWFLYNPATQSYLEPGNTPPDAITNQSATDDWFLRRRSTYSGN